MKKRWIAWLLFLAVLIGTNWLPAASAEESQTDYFQVYQDVLEQFYALSDSDYDWNEAIPGGIGVLESLRVQENLDHIGYAITDLSGDEIPELVIGYIGDPENYVGLGREIYAVYSCAGGEPVCVLEGWARNIYMRMADGNFYNQGSNGAMYMVFGSFALSPDGTQLWCNDYYFTYEKNSNYQIGYYYNVTGEWDTSKSYELNISSDEFDQIWQELSAQVVPIEMTSLSSLHPEALSPVSISWADSDSLPDYVADESEQSAVIAFRARETVQDFALLGLTYLDSDEDGNITFDIQEICRWDSLEPERPLRAKLTFAGTIPNYGFSCMDADGNVRRYAITQSGLDGSLILMEF